MEVDQLLVEKENVKGTEEDLWIDEVSEGTFGQYLRAVRQARGVSVRQMSKAVEKTATYISDIEQGNNRPPEKELLEKIIEQLDLDGYTEVRTKLYDLAARERNDVPADIKEDIMNNDLLIRVIRSIKKNPNGEQFWKRLADIV